MNHIFFVLSHKSTVKAHQVVRALRQVISPSLCGSKTFVASPRSPPMDNLILAIIVPVLLAVRSVGGLLV